MIRSSIFICFFTIAFSAKAQEYKISTSKTDSFSIALVKTMQSAINRFSDCKGELIQRTYMGEEYKLAIPFPGSSLAIVRKDLRTDALIEFTGYAKETERIDGIRKLIGQIKYALGDQLNNPYENWAAKDEYYYGLNIRDSLGAFSMNIELFGNSSAADSYILDHGNEDKSKPVRYFNVIKIYGGTPYYFYHVPEITPPDPSLHQALTQFMKEAMNDFDCVQTKIYDSIFLRRRGTDTIYFNSMPVFMSFQGNYYSANFLFEASTDSLIFKKQWEYYRQVLNAATGKKYSSFPFELDHQPYVRYTSGDQNPELNLELVMTRKGLFIKLKINGLGFHELQRGADEYYDDNADWDYGRGS